MTLINLDACSNPQHSHFDVHEKSRYPDPDAAYEETIRVTYPPLQELSYKRRASVYVRDLPAPEQPPAIGPPQAGDGGAAYADDDDSDAEESAKRFKRAIEEDRRDTISVTALAVTTTLLPREKKEFAITNATTIKEMVEAVDGQMVDALSFYAESLVVRPSVRLVPMSAAEIAANTGSNDSYKWVELVLPKGFSLALSDLEYWKMLGFTQPNITSTLAGREIAKAISNDKEDATIAEKTLTVRSANPVLPDATVESMYIAYRALMRKEKSLPQNLRNVRSALEWTPLNRLRFKIEFPRERIRYKASPSYLALTLQNILDVICEVFGFDPDVFVQIQKVGVDSLAMNGLATSDDDPEFKIKITFKDLDYAKLWGLPTTQLSYSTKQALQVALLPGLTDAHAELSEDQAGDVDAEVEKLIGNISDVSDWPERRVPIAIGARQSVYKQWTQAIAKAAEEAERKRKKEEDDRRALLQQLAEPQQPPAVVEVEQQQPPAVVVVVEPQEPPAEPQEPPAVVVVEQQQPPAVVVVGPQEPPAVVVAEPQQPPPQQVAPAQPPPPVEPRIVDEPNPQLQPPSTFTSWPPQTVINRCEAPVGFPDKYHILLLQGEPTDYIIEHGQVCILGYVNKAAVSSKGCLLVNNQIERVLEVQFVSKNLVLYAHPRPQQPNAKQDLFLRVTLNVRQVRKLK